MIDVAGIPAELKERPQWVLWRTEERQGKPTKVPYAVRGGNARTDDPETWSTFQDVVAASGGFDGVGYVFAREDPYCGVDLDDVRDPETGELHPEAQRIVGELGSYAEVSPSGRGVKITCRGELPGDRRRTGKTPWGGVFECYSERRFFTMTAEVVGGREAVREPGAALDALYRRMFPQAAEKSRDALLEGLDRTDFDRVLAERGRHAALVHLAGKLFNADLSPEAHFAALRFECDRRGWDDKGDDELRRMYVDTWTRPERDPATGRSRGGTFRIIDMDKVEAELVTWFFNGFLPVGIPTMLAAPGGTVKGLWAVHAAAHHVPGPVLYLGSEDNLAMIVKPRLLAAGVDPPSRFKPLRKTLDDGSESPLRFPSDARILEDAVEHTGARLVVVDAGVEHMDGELKMNAAEDVRRFMNPLNELCERQHVTVLLILHTNKTREASGSDRIGGSRAWVDAQRHVLVAAKDDEDDRVRHVEVLKTNIGETGLGRQYRIETVDVPVIDRETGLRTMAEQPFLVDEGHSSKSVERLLAARGKGDEHESADLESAILGHLEAEGELPAKTLDDHVSETFGHAARTVRNKRMELNRRGLTASGKEGSSWLVSITQAGHEALEAAREGS